MLFETVTTNGAAILVMLLLWTTLTWTITYMVMRYRNEKNIDVWDHHLREADSIINQLSGDLREADSLINQLIRTKNEEINNVN